MAFGLAALEDLHVQFVESGWIAAQFEDLAAFVVSEIQSVIKRPALEPFQFGLDDAKPRAHVGEVIRN